MGAWSGEPFGNDVATEWAWELEEADDWAVVRAALGNATEPSAPLEEAMSAIALAAAEVVAHGLGRPTQDDAYTGDVSDFVTRVGSPAPETVDLARSAVQRAADPAGPLALMWAGCGDEAWREAVERVNGALNGEHIPRGDASP